MDKNELRGILKQYISETDVVSDDMCRFFFSDMDKYILGSGRQAAVVLEICRNFKTDICGIISENNLTAQNMDDMLRRKGYWKECVERIPIVDVEGLNDRSNVQIILTVGEKRYQAFEDLLIEKGFKKENIFRCCWTHNTDLRKLCHRAYTAEYDRWRRDEG